ncbi:MAG: D-glycero-beta-D-manno-heptose-7-phosphate kinase [Candidatus Firestonebacteria bacterium]
MDSKKLEKILKKFNSTRVLVLGDVILDEYIFGKVNRISPEAPVPVVEEGSRSLLPGGAAYVASHISNLGGKAHLISVIGNDMHGEKIMKELSKKGISSFGLVKDSDRPTILKTRVIAQHQQIVRIDSEKRTHVSPLIVKELLGRVETLIDEVDMVVVSDYGKGVVIPSVFHEVIKMAKKRKIKIAVDPKPAYCLLYKGVTIITPNTKEAEGSVHKNIKDEASLFAAGKELLAKIKSDSVLITRGEHGMTLFEKGKKPVTIPTYARDVYDVTGAGDTVIAVLAMALASKASLLQAAYLSNFAAGVVVGKVGTAALSMAELKRAINEHKN